MKHGRYFWETRLSNNGNRLAVLRILRQQDRLRKQLLGIIWHNSSLREGLQAHSATGPVLMSTVSTPLGPLFASWTTGRLLNGNKQVCACVGAHTHPYTHTHIHKRTHAHKLAPHS